MAKVNQCLKAIYATATAALAGIGAALVQAHTFANISDGTWITIASATLVAGGAVYGVTNSTPSAGSGGSS